MNNRLAYVPVETISTKGDSSHQAEMSKAQYKAMKLKTKQTRVEPKLKKPPWIRAKTPTIENLGRVRKLKELLRQSELSSVCEEASCPNLNECFSIGTATFLIMGNICTRHCPFCDVAHGRPKPLNKDEPDNLAQTIKTLSLKHAVITSVDRDDLKDGGAEHFRSCIQKTRDLCENTIIEVLVPDFRRCEPLAISILTESPPDIFNHNLETVPTLYKEVRPGANYQKSLDLLRLFKKSNPTTPTKSGLMLGLGESIDQVIVVMQDLKKNNVDMLTLGQYLQPSSYHFPVKKYLPLEDFKHLERLGYQMGFKSVASGPMIRSSYHAELQADHINSK